MLKLVFEATTGDAKGQRFVVRSTERVSFGRTEWAEHAFPFDAEMSKKHFEIEGVGNSFVVRDLQSTNGTRLNGNFIKEHVLADGDQVRVGKTTFLVSIVQEGVQKGADRKTVESHKEIGLQPVTKSPPRGKMKSEPYISEDEYELPQADPVASTDSKPFSDSVFGGPQDYGKPERAPLKSPLRNPAPPTPSPSPFSEESVAIPIAGASEEHGVFTQSIVRAEPFDDDPAAKSIKPKAPATGSKPAASAIPQLLRLYRRATSRQRRFRSSSQFRLGQAIRLNHPPPDRKRLCRR
jgi:pSer/pThr/pTyr-binding forkhead associated (FHA) protein